MSNDWKVGKLNIYIIKIRNWKLQIRNRNILGQIFLFMLDGALWLRNKGHISTRLPR